jgi:hypothetical protein
MTSWANDDDDTPEAAADRARTELAARWMLRSGPPTPAHYVAVMEAAALVELSLADPAHLPHGGVSLILRSARA